MAKESDEGQQKQQQQKQPNNNNNSKNKVGVAGDGGDASLPTLAAAAAATLQQHNSAALADATDGMRLNDLVADLCINISLPPRPLVGDCTNIRATVGPAGYEPASAANLTQSIHPGAAQKGHPEPQLQSQPAPTQNSSFSFKHFLSSGNAMTAPSTTVTSLDPVGALASSSSLSATVSGSGTGSSSSYLQTSTGARPKVPQSASVSSATSISSLMGGLSVGGGGALETSTKMKRSPRFSSFDSQASLAEYAGASVENGLDDGVRSSGIGGSGGTSSSGFRLYPDALGAGNESRDIFAGQNSSAAPGAQHVPRSYSNYEMPMQPASPRRRMGGSGGGGGNRENARPTRFTYNTSCAKLKLDLPIDSAGGGGGAAQRPLPNNGGDFPPSALPDFVQDHWMDSWYAHEKHLNSPPNSPTCDFAEDLSGAAAPSASAGGSSAVGGICGVAGGVSGAGAAATCGGPPGERNDVGESAPTGPKMLPDFLSDGLIIHSSQRLADVAAGLPSNSIGSPEDQPMATHLSQLRIENGRLHRELNDARAALNEQTRRGNELERQLHERQRMETASGSAGRGATCRTRTKPTLKQAIDVELHEQLQGSDRNKQRPPNPMQSHVTKLKQQVTLLTAEVETLRRENEVLREDGAVGGCSSTSNCERPFGSSAATSAAAAAAAASGAAARGGIATNVSRQPQTQQISRDLLRAASNAESNLRQLLVGVDNLRQMAADIECAELQQDYDVSPDLFSDFLDDCDDYEDYAGGPAL